LVFIESGEEGKSAAGFQSTKKKGCCQPFFGPTEKRF
jgi:hypothetical protein